MPTGKLPAVGLVAVAWNRPAPLFFRVVALPPLALTGAGGTSRSPSKSAAAIPCGPAPTVTGLPGASTKLVEAASATATSVADSAPAPAATQRMRRRRPDLLSAPP